MRRDRTAQDRDIAAEQRDATSDVRDQVARERARESASAESSEADADARAEDLDEVRTRAGIARSRAGRDRDRAAADRDDAATDRARAAEDRAQAAYDRDHAGIDELTGVRRRGVGLEELESEIQRARRQGDPLVAVYVDVDGLKAVNDIQGHPAGDQLLRTVAGQLRENMRPYDLIIRLGGDEFLCVLPGLEAATVRRRFAALRQASQAHAAVSFGIGELQDSDDVQTLIHRADADLIASRGR